MTNLVAIIQARMGSTRLPGKVMKRLLGKTVLQHVVQRVRACRRITSLVIATTTAGEDDVICDEAKRLDVLCVRGSRDDVLSRFCLAARAAKADAIVRVTSDCPLLDSAVLCHLVEEFLNHQVDYCSNTMARSYPRGLDAEVFTREALERADREANLAYEREHVTPYFYEHPESFRLRSVAAGRDLSAHRWTLDTPDDWRLIERVYEAIGTCDFGMQEVLDLLQREPQLANINAHVEQKKLAG
jgi:spore coat polysaccharide biosynthesis protein SpsF